MLCVEKQSNFHETTTKICIEWDFKSSSIKKIGPNIGPCKNVPKLVQCCNILYLLPNFLGGGIGEGIQVLISCYKAYNFLRNFAHFFFVFAQKNNTRLTRKCRLFSIYTADFLCVLTSMKDQISISFFLYFSTSNTKTKI